MADEAAEWGVVDPQPELINPHPGRAVFNGFTWHILGWLSEQGLRPTQGDTRQFPPQTTVHFGAGSGWLWGQLTIMHDTGDVIHLTAHWVDANSDHRISVNDGRPEAIFTELHRHEEQRRARIRWLAGSHNLTVSGLPDDYWHDE